MATEVIMPQMGESVVEGTVGVWLKQEGDPVEQYEPIVEVETDKVTSEITAEVGGVLRKIYVNEGQTVPAGTVLAMIGEPEEEIPVEAPDESLSAGKAAEPEHAASRSAKI
jgi:pyruvate/2-oxoglutarate dehydrogenase complex dihydrolipoamide acyltransferase (E2) component